MRADLLIVVLRVANAFMGVSHTSVHHRAPPVRTTQVRASASLGNSGDVEQKFKAEQGTNARAAALMEEFDFPLGLAQQVVASAQSFPTRFWIVDDSGSMASGDGKMLSQSASGAKSIVGATRWQEISADMAVAAAVSHEAGARTEFHPLNGGRPLTIKGTDKGTPARRIRHIRPPVRTPDTRAHVSSTSHYSPTSLYSRSRRGESGKGLGGPRTPGLDAAGRGHKSDHGKDCADGPRAFDEESAGMCRHCH